MHNLKNRQPLKALHLVTRNDTEKKILIEMEDIVREELNVKEVIFRENEEELVEYSAKANFRKLGSTLGPQVQAAARKIAGLTGSEIHSLIDGTTLSIDLGDRTLDVTADDVMVQRKERENLKVLNEGSLTVALDPEITEDLRQEGLVRDLIRQIQNLRKDSGLDVSDRITIHISRDPDLEAAVRNFEEYFITETLAVSVSWDAGQGDTKLRLGDTECTARVEKA
jgi:isoleucyl-tRNA synthetase